MNPFKKLFKQTAIYGLATVLPRMLSFILVPIYTSVMAPELYGEVTLVFAWFAIFNVFLAYGMETAFFRFYTKNKDKDTVVSTSLITIGTSTLLFMLIGFLFKNGFSSLLDVSPKYIKYIIFILSIDALVIIPFAWLRVNENPKKYAIVKTLNVIVNLGLNIFFLVSLPNITKNSTFSFFVSIYQVNFEITYIFISMLVSSVITFISLLHLYFGHGYTFDRVLCKNMLKYAWPVLVAGIAFSINEVFDRILLERLLDPEIAKSQVGMYSACYKLGLFMTLFATAFRMGIEPFFFSHSSSKNPQKSYAQITNYFIIIGSIILLTVIVFVDVLKVIFVRDNAYWEAMSIVPIIILASFFLGIYHNLSVWYKVTDKTRYGAFISTIGAIITIGINYVFIPEIGYMASAIATLLAYGTMMVLSYYYGRSHYPVPYNFRKIFFYLSLSISFSALVFYGFDRSLIVGIPLLLIFLGFVYKLENENLRQIFFKK